MESAALVYLDLLEGKNKAVAGTTCEFKDYLSCTFLNTCTDTTFTMTGILNFICHLLNYFSCRV